MNVKYLEKENYYFVRLDPGEKIINILIDILSKKNIKSAIVNGIGAVKEVSVGRYEVSGKRFISKEYSGEFEITSLLGNVTMQENEIKLHIHINLANKDFRVFGGHLIEAVVSATAEIFIFPITDTLSRYYDKSTGLYKITN